MNKLQCKLQNIFNGIQKNVAYENLYYTAKTEVKEKLLTVQACIDTRKEKYIIYICINIQMKI